MKVDRARVFAIVHAYHELTVPLFVAAHACNVLIDYLCYMRMCDATGNLLISITTSQQTNAFYEISTSFIVIL
jgi:hypothetical protein